MTWLTKHTYIVGQVHAIVVTDRELEALGLTNPLQVFTRLFKDGILYHSLKWTSEGKRNDTICCFTLDDSVSSNKSIIL